MLPYRFSDNLFSFLSPFRGAVRLHFNEFNKGQYVPSNHAYQSFVLNVSSSFSFKIKFAFGFVTLHS
jgi:hypothetical protein